jgi:hypothetical protein
MPAARTDDLCPCCAGVFTRLLIHGYRSQDWDLPILSQHRAEVFPPSVPYAVLLAVDAPKHQVSVCAVGDLGPAPGGGGQDECAGTEDAELGIKLYTMLISVCRARFPTLVGSLSVLLPFREGSPGQTLDLLEEVLPQARRAAKVFVSRTHRKRVDLSQFAPWIKAYEQVKPPPPAAGGRGGVCC